MYVDTYATIITPETVGLFFTSLKSIVAVITRVNKTGFSGLTFTETLSIFLLRLNTYNKSFIFLVFKNLTFSFFLPISAKSLAAAE